MNQKLDKNATEELLKLADHLDNIGMHKEADYVDFILRKNAEQDIFSGFMSELPSSIDPVRSVKRQVFKSIIEYFGAKEGGWLALFVSNLISGINEKDFQILMYSYTAGDYNTMCDLVSEEVASALQKTTFEGLITEGAETAFEKFLFELIGVNSDGAFQQIISSAIGPGLLVQMLTTYITDNNVVSKQIADVICKQIIPGAGGAINTAISWITGTASSAMQSGQQALQNAQNQAQQQAIQGVANHMLGPTYGPQAVNLAQRVGIIP